MDLIHYKFSQYFLNATIAKLLNPPFQTVLEFSNVRMGEFHDELLNHLQTIYLEKNDFSQNAYNCCTIFQNARFWSLLNLYTEYYYVDVYLSIQG